MALSTNLFSYYDFENSGFPRVGTFVATSAGVNYSPQYGSYKKGAFILNSNSGFSAGDQNSFDNKAAISISFWICPLDTSNSQLWFFKGTGSTQSCFAIRYTGSVLRWSIYSGLSAADSNYVESTASPFTAGTWYHVACVFDGSLSGNTNRAKIYVNGSNITSTSAGTIPAVTTNGTGTVRMGAQDGTGANPGIYLDEVGFWDKALTSAEVSQLYNLGIALPFPFDGSIRPNNMCAQFCNWLLTSNYYRFSPARVSVIQTVQAAALAGNSVTEHQWNQYLSVVGPFIVIWEQQNNLSN